MYEFYPICLLTSTEPGKYMFVFKVLVGHLATRVYPKTAVLLYAESSYFMVCIMIY